MYQIKPTKIADPFMDQTLPTMADLIGMVKASPELSEVRRCHLASSIRRFCAALGYEPGQVPANHSYFRDRLRRFHPLEAGIAKKRWQTIKSDVNAALAHSGITKGQTRGLAPLTPAWAALKVSLNGWRYNWGFSRLARYCSNQGRNPANVDDTVMANFAEAMREETFKTNIDTLMRDLCVDWNKLVCAAPDLGLQDVTVPSRSKLVSLPWESVPESFRTDTERFLAEMSTDVHPLSLTGPIRPLKPASIKTYRYAIRHAHAALVRSGFPAQDITSLSILVTPDNARTLLKNLLERNDSRKSSAIHGIAHVLYLIAGPGNRGPAGAADALNTMRGRLATKHSGMRDKPREALRQFTDARNIETILVLPLHIYGRMQRKSALTIADALRMQVGVALEILLMRPIRRKNLTELRLDENVIRRDKDIFIRLPSNVVKNAVELDYRLPPESAQLLNYYIKQVLPLFGPNPGGWLFPGAIKGKHKSYEQLSRQFIKVIREETGLYLYPHLTRHFAAKIYLNENPGAFEIVRRVLGHRSLTTTTRSYASFDDDAAVRLYDSLVLRIRESVDKESKHG